MRDMDTTNLTPSLELQLKHDAELRQLRERQEAQRTEQNQKIADEREAKLKAEEDAKAEERRKQADEELTELLRRNFYAGAPNASAQDFDRLLPKLRDEWILEQAKRDPVAELAAELVASAPAGFKGVF